MNTDTLAQQIEAFVSWDCEPEQSIPIARRIPTAQLAEFFGEARTRLDALAKEWAQDQPRCAIVDWRGPSTSAL